MNILKKSSRNLNHNEYVKRDGYINTTKLSVNDNLTLIKNKQDDSNYFESQIQFIC